MTPKMNSKRFWDNPRHQLLFVFLFSYRLIYKQFIFYNNLFLKQQKKRSEYLKSDLMVFSQNLPFQRQGRWSMFAKGGFLFYFNLQITKDRGGKHSCNGRNLNFAFSMHLNQL